MAIDFPASPTVGQIYNFGGVTYTFTAGGVWSTAAAGLAVGIQRFTASGTYTPMAGISYAVVECVGGGAGGGGANAGTASQSIAAGGGGSGGYSRKILTAAQIGASQTITIGAGGNGGAAGTNPGLAGGDTSFGSLCIAKGGSGGLWAVGGVQPGSGGAGGVAGTGDITAAGAPGGQGATGQTAGLTWANAGEGGSSVLGGGATTPYVFNTLANGVSASNYGSGGSGGIVTNATGNVSGGNGSAGIVIITEYAGSPTGASGGNVISSGVPLNGQIAQWTSSNTIQGTNAPGLLTLITSQTVSTPVASVDFTTGINNTYDEYELHVISMTLTAADQPSIRISQDGGGTWISTASYQRSGYIATAGNTLTASGTVSGTALVLSAIQGLGTGGLPLSSIVRFFSPASTGIWKGFIWSTVYHDSTNGISSFVQSGTFTANTNAINGIRLFNTSGNTFTGGIVNLYGVRK